MRFKNGRILHLIFFLGILGACFLSSCSKEDVELPDLLQEKTYSSSNLLINYCGQEMPGKSVTLIPSGTSDSRSVVLRCQGATDLDQLSSIGLSGTGAAPGVVPGSPVIELPVDLTLNKEGYLFSGSKSTDICSFDFNGTITEQELNLNIENVRLDNLTCAGSVWKPQQFKQNGLEVTSMPFHLLWEIDPAVGIDVDLTGLLKLLVTAPIVPTYHDTAYSSLSQLLSSSLQTIAFLENGNVILRYYSSVGGATQLMTSQGPTLQYFVNSPSQITLYPNPTSLFGLWLVAQSDSSGIPDISFKLPPYCENSDASASADDLKEALLPLVKELVPVFLQMTMQGIPVQVSKSETGVNAYLDTKTLLTIIGQVVNVALQHPEILEKLLKFLPDDAETADTLQLIQELLPQIETILSNTTRLELGLSLTPYSATE